jgi:hypothetical protein
MTPPTQSDLLEADAIRDRRDWQREMERARETPDIRSSDEQVEAAAQIIIAAVNGWNPQYSGTPSERGAKAVTDTQDLFGSVNVQRAVELLRVERAERTRERKWIEDRLRAWADVITLAKAGRTPTEAACSHSRKR